MCLIKLNNVNKVYGKSLNLVNALTDINLKIEIGELIAIVGASGSGKSTLLNIIGLIEEKTDGMYLLEGGDVSKLRFDATAKLRNKHIGFVVQNFALINDYTVEQNIQIPLEYAKKSKKERLEITKKICCELGIIEKINSYVKELSGGQCQRVAIARALSNNPQIILADEPTGALDKATGQEVIDIFKRLNREGKTVIIVTHDFNIANQCDRVITLEDGKILSDKLNKVEMF